MTERIIRALTQKKSLQKHEDNKNKDEKVRLENVKTHKIRGIFITSMRNKYSVIPEKMTNSSQNESRLPAVVFPMIVLWGGKNNDSMVISEIENYFFPIFFSCFFFCHLPHPPHPPPCLKWANIKVLSPSGGASFFL